MSKASLYTKGLGKALHRRPRESNLVLCVPSAATFISYDSNSSEILIYLQLNDFYASNLIEDVLYERV